MSLDRRGEDFIRHRTDVRYTEKHNYQSVLTQLQANSIVTEEIFFKKVMTKRGICVTILAVLEEETTRPIPRPMKTPGISGKPSSKTTSTEYGQDRLRKLCGYTRYFRNMQSNKCK